MEPAILVAIIAGVAALLASLMTAISLRRVERLRSETEIKLAEMERNSTRQLEAFQRRGTQEKLTIDDLGKMISSLQLFRDAMFVAIERQKAGLTLEVQLAEMQASAKSYTAAYAGFVSRTSPGDMTGHRAKSSLTEIVHSFSERDGRGATQVSAEEAAAWREELGRIQADLRDRLNLAIIRYLDAE